MNRCRTLLVGAVLAVPLATFGIAAESAFADEDLCGAITDNPDPRDCEDGMGFSLEEESEPSQWFPTGCPVVPYQGKNFSANCSFAPTLSSQSQPLDAPALPAVTNSADSGLSTTAVAGAGAAALLLAIGAPVWIRRMRSDS